jgi:threonine aldolase
MIDLRSDTVTRPSPAMRQAMANAEVGDDVLGDDPTVLALQEEVARIVGKEASLFVPSGTMGNQLAIHCQTQRGDEVIVGEGAHPVWYEAGAGAALSGVQFATAGTTGTYTAAEMIERVKPDAYYYPRTSLVCVENTHNRAGGRVFPQVEVNAIVEAAHVRGLRAHLDGARIWNASVATGVPVDKLAAGFDTVSVCFSKGLGAPIGSALSGSKELIVRAHRTRKMWGAGMRQVGVLAAAALYALRNNRARLAEDHANAKLLAQKLEGARGVKSDARAVETNIVNIDLAEPLAAADVSRIAGELGLAINASGPRRLRAVTHLDVTQGDVEKAAGILTKAVLRALEASA